MDMTFTQAGPIKVQKGQAQGSKKQLSRRIWEKIFYGAREPSEYKTRNKRIDGRE